MYTRHAGDFTRKGEERRGEERMEDGEYTRKGPTGRGGAINRFSYLDSENEGVILGLFWGGGGRRGG